ncbi:MAG: tetratricopeptide repeat protein [Acidobacteriota bacterium]|nr:tetratricopeptide repeat protein [Acidobacteriota bacterium]
MSFDKTKAMRNAERFLSQGKIRAAISEYQRIVENDPKDFSTLNILGDLYAKNSEKQEAVGCFTQVAEYYNMQGFANKAIAIYNKISRIEPNLMEVSAKLAQLYKSKGSVSEAKTHYTLLAEQYQRKGQKIEALAIWKQIAELDPNNTDIYLKIAEVCWQEDQHDDAAKAFTEAGLRLTNHGQFEPALTAFSKALEIKKNYLRALNGMVKAQIGLGCADEAAITLESILVEQPYNRDILYLLVDCYLDVNNPQEAEKAVIKLVEQEPANYPKFLELVKIYLKNNDLDSAARILSMSSEHLLVGGQAEDFLSWTNEILARNPEQIDALRLLVRYYGWQRHERELKKSLERLAETARLIEAVGDERYALSQLVLIAPHEVGNAQRLQEINIAHGFEANEFENDLAETPQFEIFVASEINQESTTGYNEYGFANDNNSLEHQFDDLSQNGFSKDVKEFNFYGDEAAVIKDNTQVDEFQFKETNGELNLADEMKLQKELEGIEFYIAQDYKDLAVKSLDALEIEFGRRTEFEALRFQLDDSLLMLATKTKPVIKESAPEILNVKFDILDELKNELGFEEVEAGEVGEVDDYEMHYHRAVAYHDELVGRCYQRISGRDKCHQS